MTVLRACARLSNSDPLREAAWLGCSPAQLKTFYLVRQRVSRACGVSGEMRASADVVSEIAGKCAEKLARNRLVKRMGALVSCDGKFQASAPLTGVKWQQAPDGTVVLFESAFQTKEGEAKCYGLHMLDSRV